VAVFEMTTYHVDCVLLDYLSKLSGHTKDIIVIGFLRLE
jgi:hypothetical protein